MTPNPKPLLVRITTIPASMQVLLKGQIRYMKDNGFEVVMVSSDGAEIEALKAQEGAEHFIVPFTRKISPVQDLKCLIRLTRFLKKVKPSVVHTHTPKAGLLGMWAAWFAGVPVRLHTIAGLPWMETTGAMRWLLKTIEKITFLPATRVFPNSVRQMQFLLENNIGQNKMEVLGKGSSNGIDTDHFRLTPEVREGADLLKGAENIKADGWVWIFIGRLVKDKGLEELLDGFSKIYNQYPDDRLWLLGNEEPELDPLSPDYVKILHNHPGIKRWGFIKDVRPYLAASRVLVFPSYREGFPNVPMQAGALGCALILSDINGCNEIVSDTKTGILVPAKNSAALTDAMISLRIDETRRAELSGSIREHIVNNYDQKKLWEIIREQYVYWMELKK